jgi:predicted component of type VI protein secretion system
VINVAFEPETLKLGRLQARHLHIRFPDGTLIDTDNADDLPPVLSLESESQDMVVVLALPLLRATAVTALNLMRWPSVLCAIASAGGMSAIFSGMIPARLR